MTPSQPAGVPTTTAATRRGLASFGVALALLVTLAIAVGLTFVAAPAQAAYTTVQKAHGGKLQACKKPATRNGVSGLVVRIRIDNRAAPHVHLGGMTRFRDGKSKESVDFRVGAGTVSPTKAIFFDPRRDLLSVGMGDANGQGAGGDYAFNALARC